MSSFKVIIIGAVLAGSCLANGLMKHDIDVHVYGLLPSDSKREGYQIRFGAHALRGMRACLLTEELQRIVSNFGPANEQKSEAPIVTNRNFGPANGQKSEAPNVTNRNFDTMVDLSKIPSYNKSAPISRVVLRDALAEPVAAAGKLTYGAKFLRYDILNPGSG